MIQAIILDIDGVIVGDKKGVNTPYPHPEVISKLHEVVTLKKIPIILCTAKPHFAIGKIIKDANLNNPHITDGGAVLIDPLHDKIIETFPITSSDAIRLLDSFLKSNIYIEFYTTDDYLAQINQKTNITEQHEYILQRKPKFVESLINEAGNRQITKLMPIVHDEEEKDRANLLFEEFKNSLTLNWTIHPVALPLQFGIITAKSISKKESAVKLMKYMKIPLEQVLGVGDSTSDWSFIQLCGYKAAMANASAELRSLVSGQNNSLIGGHVDENGIIGILDHFLNV